MKRQLNKPKLTGTYRFDKDGNKVLIDQHKDEKFTTACAILAATGLLDKIMARK